MFSIIKNCFRKMKIKKDISSFKKYLIKIEDSFLYISPIKNPEINLIEYRNKINLVKKYSKYAIKFDELTSKIALHNETIEEIISIVESFSFNNFIDNFDLFSQEEIDILINTAKKLKNYKSYKESYKTFIKEVNELNENQITIKEQLAIRKDCSNGYNQILLQDSYINEKKSIKIKKILI